MARYLYQIHIADGFVDDCENLIERCSKFPVLTYTTFTEIWREMNFGYIYQDRSLGVEIAELSEEVSLIAKRFMLAQTTKFEEQVAGLFLVYGLLRLQPYPGFTSLRILPDDVPAIGRIEMVARRDRRLDVLYILGQVLIKGPVHYVATEREYAFEASYRKYLEVSSIIRDIRPLGQLERQNQILDSLLELKKTSRKYHKAKECLTRVKPDRSLNYSDEKIYEKAEESLKKLIIGQSDAEMGVEEINCNKRSNVVSEIKSRAMKNVVDTIKPLCGVQERNNRRKKKKSEGDSKPTTSEKKKRRGTRRIKTKGKARKGKGKGKRSKQYSSSESEDDDDIDMHLDDGSLSPPSDEETELELNWQNFGIASPKRKKAKLNDGTESKQVPARNGSMPIILNNFYAVESVNNCKKDGTSTIDVEVRPIFPRKLKRHPKLCMEDDLFVVSKCPQKKSENNANDDHLFKKPLLKTYRSRKK